jgi:RNA polymerase sigma-70 factor (ECF subfamily)
MTERATRPDRLPLSAQSPEELAARAQEGSAAAYGELVSRFQDRLYCFLLRRTACESDAEDVAQETFLRAWRRIGLYRPTSRFSTWLFTIGARLASSHRRTVARRASLRPPADPLQAADPGAGSLRNERRSRVWDVVERTLGDDQRTIVWLRYSEGLSMKEIAEVLGKSQVGVRVSLFRAREALAARPELAREVEREAPAARPFRAPAVAGGVR